jgi:hypothetical protein
VASKSDTIESSTDKGEETDHTESQNRHMTTRTHMSPHAHIHACMEERARAHMLTRLAEHHRAET